MPRQPTLIYDRGTLILHPPPRGKAWIDFATWDDRVEKFRIPAVDYAALVSALKIDKISFQDQAAKFDTLTELQLSAPWAPYAHQEEALTAWKQSLNRGVVVLPTAAGKTYLAHLAIAAIKKSTLIVVPTLDLLHQWSVQTQKILKGIRIGLLGGGSNDRDQADLLVATYHSAAIQAESLGNRYGLIVFDECHHLPSSFFSGIAESSIAPYRLGLSATPERADGSHQALARLIGPVVYRRSTVELAKVAIAEFEVISIKVSLSELERRRYEQAIQTRNQFLRDCRLSLGSVDGWQRFVQASARSPAGRRAMQAHRLAKELAFGTEAKFTALAELITKHIGDRMLIFTNDNRTVYQLSRMFLLPVITHQTPVKERQQILDRFRRGDYPIIGASHVLNEGVDVPSAQVGIILSGTGSHREYIQRLGRLLRKNPDHNRPAILYELIALDTSEEKTAARRREINCPSPTLKAAELPHPWQSDD
ncbi:MAG: DEAD/DEAH box helicase family protein [Cyanobacteria bacterium P01_H01_bin.15]